MASLCVLITRTMSVLSFTGFATTQSLKDKDWKVRLYVAEALGMIGPAAKEAVPALTKLLEDEDARESARKALMKIDP